MPVINSGDLKTLNYDVTVPYPQGGVVFRDKYGTYTTDARTYTPPVGIIMKSPTQEDHRLFVKLIAPDKCLMDYQEFRK